MLGFSAVGFRATERFIWIDVDICTVLRWAGDLKRCLRLRREFAGAKAPDSLLDQRLVHAQLGTVCWTSVLFLKLRIVVLRLGMSPTGGRH